MSGAAKSRRTEAEVDAAAAVSGCAGIGSRSIHQFWHLFSAHYRGILLAPRRRPDSGKVAWGWREPPTNPTLTAAELAEVRRRLAQASRALTGTPGQAGSAEDADDDSLDSQVRARVARMTADLVAKPDSVLAGFVCRDEAGLMLHSWGSAQPAHPTYPDSQQGEISGRVIVDDGDAAGLGVLLENNAGLGVARTKADGSGAFHLQGIAPGRYRLRVVNRTDFPADGLPVVLEKTALTGIELRSNAQAKARSGATAPQPGPQKSRRHLAGVAIVLTLLAASGVAWWRHHQTPGAREQPRATDTGWRSARGDLHAADGASPRENGRPRGDAAAGIALNGPVTAPSLEARNPAPAALLESGGMAKPTLSAGRLGEAPPPDFRSRAGGNLESDAGEPNSPAQKPAKDPVGAVSRQRVVRQVGESAEMPAAAGGGTESVARTVSSDRPVSGSESLEAEDLHDRAKSANLHATVRPVDTDKPGAGVVVGAQSVAAGAGVGSAPKPGSGSAQSAAGRGQANPVRRSAEDSGGSTSHPGPSRQERTGASEGSGSTVASADNAAAAGAAEPPVQKSAPTDRPTAERDEHSRQEEAIEPAATGNDTSPKIAPTRATTGVSPVPDDPGAAAEVPRKTGEASAGAIPSAANNLIALGGIRVGAWKPRLLQDEILATVPTADGQREALGTLREQALAARAGSMPAAFRSPTIWNGYRIDLSGLTAGSAPGLRWQDVAGRQPAGAIVQDARAEFAWDASHPLPRGVYDLTDSHGVVHARVRVETGLPVLTVVSAARATYWVAVACAPADRFRWQDPPPSAVGSSAYEGFGPWAGQRAVRLDLPLQPGRRELTGQTVSLADDATGWALATLLGPG